MTQMSLKNAVTHLENLSKDWSNPIMIQAWKIVHAKIKESVPSTSANTARDAIALFVRCEAALSSAGIERSLRDDIRKFINQS
jgi:hypothetical protein